MSKLLKRVLAAAVLAAVAILLLWAFHEGREEWEKERERERPITGASHVSRTAEGETVVSLDPETQTRLALRIEIVAELSASPLAVEPKEAARIELLSIQNALNVLETEDARLEGSPRQEKRTLPPPFIQGSQTTNQVLVPHSALIWWEGKTWVYLQSSPDTFVRREITLDRPTEQSWLLTAGVRPGERIVVTGAQILLSEELKSQIQILEEGESP